MNDAQIWTLIVGAFASQIAVLALLGTFAKGYIDAKFDGLGVRFDAVDAKFAAVDARFEAVEARFDAVDVKFDAVNQRIDLLDRDVQRLVERHFKEPDA